MQESYLNVIQVVKELKESMRMLISKLVFNITSFLFCRCILYRSSLFILTLVYEVTVIAVFLNVNGSTSV